MTSKPPQLQPPLRVVTINDKIDDDDNNDDAQSDISIPYSSLTESTTSTNSGFLTPTSSDAPATVEGVNLQTINSALHEMDSSSYHHDEHFDNTILMQWRVLHHDEIERQIVNNRNRDRNRDRSDTATTLSAGNLRLHNTSQTSTTLAGEGGGGGGARLNGSEQTRRRRGERGGEGSRSSLHDSSSPSSSSSSSFIKFVTIRHFLFVLILAFSFTCLHVTVLSLSRSTTSPSNMSHDHDDLEFPPLTIPSPAPTATHTQSSTPTPAYESAPSSPSGAGAQKSKPRPPPPSRYTRHASPLPNQTFILLESSTGRALTLIDGNLRLVHVPDPDLISISDKPDPRPSTSESVAVPPCVTKGQCNWHWHCVETSGWLGFRNAASGTLLGHEMWGDNIIAKAYNHNGWEFMAVRPAPATAEGKGGWYLMITHWEKLHKIQFSENRGGLVMRDPNEVEGTVWEFVRV